MIATISESSDDFGIFDQPTSPEEDPDKMGIQRKPQKSLLELMEGQSGKNVPAKTIPSQASSLPARSPPPAPRQPPRSSPQPALPNAAEQKRRREQKGKDVVDTSKSRPNRKEEAQRAAKQQKTKHQAARDQDKSDSQYPEPRAWLPAPMHDGEPLRDDASIRDFNGGIGCHIIQNTFKLDEMLNACSDQLDDERKRRATAIQTLSKFEQDLADAKKNLQVEVQARKSAESALEGYQKQAEDQGRLLRKANAELKKTQEQTLVLRKHLEETQKLRERAEKSKEQAEKAKIKAEQTMNEAEQRGYEIGIAETEKALRAEVPEVCRIYYARTWSEALNRVGVKASSELRKLENIFYPEAIRPSVLLPHQTDAPSSVINLNEEVLPRNSPPRGQPESAKEGLAPPGASQTRPPLLRRQRRPPKVFNGIWTPQFYQLGTLPKPKRESQLRRQTYPPSRTHRSS
ncbi:inner centromere protein-like [Quercus lobata]|uniref:inner centromere protein-like n=1 Tax=Quercus lobata TaxID=97700 RepID=UPI001246B2C2|nr:inner centromere protein-like [Quercus lobata]